LDDPIFHQDVVTFLSHLDSSRERSLTLSQAQRDAEADRFFGRSVLSFKEKWDVWPPKSADVLDATGARQKAAAILTGRWGMIPVFPFTTNADIAAAVTRIRKAIGRKHQDAQNASRVARGLWLLEQGFPPEDVARAAWGKQWKKLSHKQEEWIMRALRGKGVPYRKAEQAILKRTPHKSAQSMIRTARNRYNRALDIGRRETDSPVNSDPVSRAITRLLRDVFCEPHVFPSSLVSHAKALRTALLGSPAA
jgi:hypothetical protein